MIPWQQYADALLAYAIDFTDQLGGDVLVSGSAAVTATDEVIVTAIEVGPALVEFRLSGGTPGALATITCKAVSAGGLTCEAKPQLRILA